MASGASHYRDAETLMAQADQSAIAANVKAIETGDPMQAVPGLLGAFVTMIAANNHALLAGAAASALNIRRNSAMTDGSDTLAGIVAWAEVLRDA